MQKWIAVGNLTKDTELRRTQTGQAVTNFTIAITRARNKDIADFIDCVAWGKLAETINNYCHKGDRIGVVGEIQTRKYQANDGSNKTVVEANVTEIQFLKTKKAGSTEPQEESETTEVEEDDLPF